MDFKSILEQIAYDFGMELDDVCFSVSTENYDFPFSFFEFENECVLGINVTNEEGLEKLHIVVKSKIDHIRIHYLDELYDLMLDDTSNLNDYKYQ